MRFHLLLSAWLLISCASPLDGEARGGKADGEYHYHRGIRLRMADERDAALAEFGRALALAPECVEAHREMQNIMLDLGFQEDLIRYYAKRLVENPRSARARYLYGRLLDDPAQQDREFSRAIRLDPGFFWGHYGKAVAAMRRGKLKQARSSLRRALAIEPSSPHARLTLGMLESLSGKHEEALRIAEGLIGEDEVSRDAYDAALWECLLLDLRKKGGELSARGVSAFPRSAPLRALRGYFLAGEDDLAAIDAYRKANASEPLAFVFIRDLRRLYARAGMHLEAVSLWREAFGSQLEREGNRILPLWRGLEESANAACARGDAGSLVDLARAYDAIGWWEEAAGMREALAGSGAITGDVAAMLESDDDGSRLLGALTRYGRDLAIRAAGEGRAISFRRAVRELGARTAGPLGRSLVVEPAVSSITGLQWFGGRGGRPQPLLDILRSGNRELIFFKNIFRGRLNFEFGEVIYCAPIRSEEGGFTYWAITCCLSGDGVMEGESGLTYPPFHGYAVFYDPGRWRDLCESRRLQRRNPLESGWFLEDAGGSPIGPLDICYSRMLERRLFEKVCAAVLLRPGERLESRIEDLYAGCVAPHEYQHILDLRRHLPIWRHPFRGLAVASRNLFIPSRIEEWFEERAMARSILRCGDPIICLLDVHAQLGGGDNPHARAARRLLGKIAAEIAGNPREFPEVNCRRNILNQLYLLEGERLREVVSGLCAEELGLADESHRKR